MTAQGRWWAKEVEGSAITVNVLVPGGPTDTPMISDQAGWPREKMLRPEIMGPPILWLVSDNSAGFNGQRITAARWDASLPPAEAAKRAIGWPELSADAIWLTGVLKSPIIGRGKILHTGKPSKLDALLNVGRFPQYLSDPK